MTNSNGTQVLPTVGTPRYRISQSLNGNGDSTHLPESAPMLVRLQRIGCAMRMTIRVLAIGIGTTGAACVDLWVKRILLERAGRGLPKTFDYLLMDAANPQPGLDIAHFYQLLGGHGGSGSVAHEGHKLFFTPDNYRRLRHTLNTKTLGIMDGESEFVTKSAHEATGVIEVIG